MEIVELARKQSPQGLGVLFKRCDPKAASGVLVEGWISPRIAEAFGVREDTVRLRSRRCENENA